MLIIAAILTPSLRAEQKPFTQEQVSNMVRAGLGDDSGAKLIEQRGIDFAPAEDFIQSLKAAGASEAFLDALRAAKPPAPASAKKPLNQVQVFALLVGQVPSHRVTMLVQERGIDFEPTGDYLQEVRLAGGEDELISALKSAKVTKPKSVDPEFEALQAEIQKHVERGAKYLLGSQYTNAESEYRAALHLDPQSADLHFCLGLAIGHQGNRDGEVAEYREALRLNPAYEPAQQNLAIALGGKGNKSVVVPTSILGRESAIMPASELAKLDGSCRMLEATGGFVCDIYNGSYWNVSEVTVQITVKQREKKKGDSIVLTRLYRLSQPSGTDLEPAKSGGFSCYLGFSLSKGQRWQWSFVSANGSYLTVK
jgi:tetratricopeptide (TPR) repeat protein